MEPLPLSCDASRNPQSEATKSGRLAAIRVSVRRWHGIRHDTGNSGTEGFYPRDEFVTDFFALERRYDFFNFHGQEIVDPLKCCVSLFFCCHDDEDFQLRDERRYAGILVHLFGWFGLCLIVPRECPGLDAAGRGLVCSPVKSVSGKSGLTRDLHTIYGLFYCFLARESVPDYAPGRDRRLI